MKNIGIHVTGMGVNVIVRSGAVLEFARVFTSMDEVRSLVKNFSGESRVDVAQTLPHYLSHGTSEEEFVRECELLFPKTSASKIVKKIFSINGSSLCGVYEVGSTVFGDGGKSQSHVLALAALVANDRNHCTIAHVEETTVEVFDLSARGTLTNYTSARWSTAQDIGEALYGRGEIVFCGNGLRRDVMDEARSLASVQGVRLNAFGLMSSALAAREREYCSRTSHLFGAAVGVTLLK